jgi:hypothetical protein
LWLFSSGGWSCYWIDIFTIAIYFPAGTPHERAKRACIIPVREPFEFLRADDFLLCEFFRNFVLKSFHRRDSCCKFYRGIDIVKWTIRL